MLFSKVKSALILLAFAAAGGTAQAQDAGLTCYDGHHQFLDVNNDQVAQWEQTTRNQFHSRAHIHGNLARIYNDATAHNHMSVQIGATDDQRIEVIYNEEFGALPQLQVGDDIEACGDYITATAQSGPYPPSPDGAIVHWVHQSDNPNHESGFLIINGTLYGYSQTGSGY